MLPQQSTGLVLVLLRDDLPPLVAQQRHEQPARRIPHPSRMDSGSHHVELGRLAALQPAAGDGVLMQGSQADAIAQVGGGRGTADGPCGGACPLAHDTLPTARLGGSPSAPGIAEARAVASRIPKGHGCVQQSTPS